ncbi:host specificity protein J [Pseudomonas syringae group genomosp. 3]|uniref:host specificity protein J n=1 Tax=Pseudomonas syringae group genomosp. 3 TaxID=251701 RepID=UPI000EFE853B|nr:host specificity protein J [Pseudomonas syringae group genomosp. 3]RMV03432.1 Host specificity protein J [Pseudomonas syringae pv. tomato]
MQSHNYVPGVSGWKIDETGRLELNDGNRRVIAKMIMVTTAGPGMTNDQAQASVTESLRDEVAARSHADESAATQIGALQCNVGCDVPFTAEGDQIFINGGRIAEGVITNKMAPRPGFSDSVLPGLSVKMNLTPQGRYFAAGIGLGFPCEGGHTGALGDKEERVEVKADFSFDVSKGLDQLSAAISETELAKALSARIDSIRAADHSLSARIANLEASIQNLRTSVGTLTVGFTSSDHREMKH